MKRLTVNELQKELIRARIGTLTIICILLIGWATTSYFDDKITDDIIENMNTLAIGLNEHTKALNQLNNQQQKIGQAVEVMWAAMQTNSSIVECNIIVEKPSVTQAVSQSDSELNFMR